MKSLRLFFLRARGARPDPPQVAPAAIAALPGECPTAESLAVVQRALERIRRASDRIDESTRVLEQSRAQPDPADCDRIRELMVALRADALQLQALLGAIHPAGGPSCATRANPGSEPVG